MISYIKKGISLFKDYYFKRRRNRCSRRSVAWTERQSKFIGNSVRTYEFFGYDWWMPFWDREFVDYWSGISYENRLHKSIFKKYVNDLATSQGFEFKETDSIRDRLVSSVKRILPEGVKNRLRKIREIHSFKKHPMAWYGIFEDRYVLEQIRNGATMINSLLAMDYLNDLIAESLSLALLLP